MSYDGGEGVGDAEPAEQKAARVDVNFRRET